MVLRFRGRGVGDVAQTIRVAINDIAN